MARTITIKTFTDKNDFSCNVYICSSEKGSFIVDLGYFDSEIENYLKTIPPVKFVIQTHGHYDHIMGLNAFSEKYPGVEYYCHKDEIEVIMDFSKNCSPMAGILYCPWMCFKTLDAGIVDLFGYKIKVIHTPGHTMGSCMFYLEEENCVFTGDTLIENSIGRTDLPTGDESAIFRSLNKIKAMTFPEDTDFFFGHGSSLTYRELMKNNSFLR